MAGFEIIGADHTGFTVPSVERSISFWHDTLGLPLAYNIVLDGDFAAAVTGVPEARIQVAYVTLPDGHGIEFLQYLSPHESLRQRFTPKSCDIGSVHIALKVKGLESFCDKAKDHGFVRLSPPQTIPEGALAGTRVLYVRGPDGETVELIETPTR
jgi:catechol 2,3-dioxygenase-like lactoylglutathione lyase family enzyme